MKLKKDKVCYIASYDRNHSIGVHHKIEGIMRAAISMGYQSQLIQEYAKTIKDKRKLCIFLLKSDAKYFFIRSFDIINIFLLIHFIIARLQGKVLILDLPTPMKAMYYELFSIKKSFLKTTLYKILYCLNGPWVFWPFNKIIQYGNEGGFFKIGNKSRTIKLGNGIDVNRMKLRKKNYQWPANTLKLIGVANVSFYHGYDRIINAIALWNNNSDRAFNVSFSIIGGGSCIKELQELTDKLNLKDYVFFLGEKESKQIIDYYALAHLAVSSIGLFRLKLNESSVLKTREYCLAGIPFIASGDDPDFKQELPFRMLVGNDENLDDIIKVFKNFDSKQKMFTDEVIREYALKNLSFESKLETLGFKVIEKT